MNSVDSFTKFVNVILWVFAPNKQCFVRWPSRQLGVLSLRMHAHRQRKHELDANIMISDSVGIYYDLLKSKHLSGNGIVLVSCKSWRLGTHFHH